MSNTPHDHGSGSPAAQHAPLALRSSPGNAAQTCPRSALVIRRLRRGGSALPTLSLHTDAGRLPAVSAEKIQKFVLRHPAKSTSAIE